MKTLARSLFVVVLLAPFASAQEHYTQGPVWRVTLIRVKPTHFDDYLTTLQHSTKPFYEEAKSEGVILDYKIFLKETKANPEDWDIAVAVEYKNHAAMDGADAKFEAVRDKVLGGKQHAMELAQKRQEIREEVSSDLLQEVFLK